MVGLNPTRLHNWVNSQLNHSITNQSQTNWMETGGKGNHPKNSQLNFCIEVLNELVHQLVHLGPRNHQPRSLTVKHNNMRGGDHKKERMNSNPKKNKCHMIKRIAIEFLWKIGHAIRARIFLQRSFSIVDSLHIFSLLFFFFFHFCILLLPFFLSVSAVVVVAAAAVVVLARRLTIVTDPSDSQLSPRQ